MKFTLELTEDCMSVKYDARVLANDALLVACHLDFHTKHPSLFHEFIRVLDEASLSPWEFVGNTAIVPCLYCVCNDHFVNYWRYHTIEEFMAEMVDDARLSEALSARIPETYNALLHQFRRLSPA